MFEPGIYAERRKRLHSLMGSGVAIFPGNTESPMNYPSNCYRFRQDSDFLYFFGNDIPDLAGVMDFDSGEDIMFGNNFGIDDIIWMGPQPSVRELAEKCGVVRTASLSELERYMGDIISSGRKLHFLPPYRSETKMLLGRLLNVNPFNIRDGFSETLAKAVISLRSIKDQVELTEIEKAVAIAREMHVAAMKMCREGVTEQEIYGTIEGIALAAGWGPSFPIILSINGQTLHNHYHGNLLREGRMMVTDAGAETLSHYSSDITRSTPVNGRFSTRQKEIYETVLNANTESIRLARPGISNLDLHLNACRIIAKGMKDLGLMRGDMDEAVRAGAHALFMPHGLGHMMGLDVHDMEALGENLAGYNEQVRRSGQFGLAALRFALPYKPGHVFTIEPGCYFIPELIDLWRAESKFTEFINYEKVEKWKDFGGIRIEDNVVITSDGSRLLGIPIPKTVADVEECCAS